MRTKRRCSGALSSIRCYCLIFFVVAWRTFGLRAALVCMVAYGATSVYQFGSNWGGSTLRNDWMVLLGLGVCALKSRRLVPRGDAARLGRHDSCVPRARARVSRGAGRLEVCSRLCGILEPDGRASPLDEAAFRSGQGRRPALCVVALVVWCGLSTTTFGWNESWGAWSEKISMHATRPNVNHLGITALASYDHDNLWHVLRERGEDPGLWGPRTAQTMKDRRWLIVLGMLFYTGLAVRASRRLRLSDAAVIGTMMIPIYFYPSNYYLHIAFIWPLMLAAWPGGTRTREWSLVAATVLAACAIEWFGWLIPGNYGRFLFWSGVLLGTDRGAARRSQSSAIGGARLLPELLEVRRAPLHERGERLHVGVGAHQLAEALHLELAGRARPCHRASPS